MHQAIPCVNVPSLTLLHCRLYSLRAMCESLPEYFWGGCFDIHVVIVLGVTLSKSDGDWRFVLLNSVARDKHMFVFSEDLVVNPTVMSIIK